MKLTIVLDQPTQATLASLPVPGLQRLLGIGKQSRVDDASDAILCQAVSIEKQADWPVAAISCLGENNLLEVGAYYWFNVDFVHFVLQRDYFTLADILPLDIGEAADLLVSLNRHFAEDGLEFIQGERSGQCYLRLKSDPEISTTQPQQVIGLETTSYMPLGAGAAKWNRLLNEMQMLMFEHPVNESREQRGELAANSIWLSGGGVLPRLADAQYSERLLILGETPLARGLNLLGQQAGIPVPSQGMPANAKQLFSYDADSLWLIMQNKDMEIENAEGAWFAPLLHALKQRKLMHLTLLFEQPGHLVKLQVSPCDTWKFWRKSLPLAGLLPQFHH